MGWRMLSRGAVRGLEDVKQEGYKWLEDVKQGCCMRAGGC